MSVPVALATCLPSLMPLMDKVMTRKMQRMLMDDSIPDRKRMGLIMNALMDVTRGFRGVSRNYIESPPSTPKVPPELGVTGAIG